MTILPTNGFSHLADLLEKRTGQVLHPTRHWRVEMALKPVLRRHSIPDISVLSELIQNACDAALEQDCIDAMLNNETSFFRDQANFALLTGPVLDALHARRSQQRRLRIWSAACSTGQEPYSLAISFAENNEKWAGWLIEIVASDISMSALAQAKLGKYSQFEVQRGMPVRLMLNYFEQKDDEWLLRDDIRRKVSFRKHDLVDTSPNWGAFDIILCRNMIMYLGQGARELVFTALSARLAPDGVLMLGAAETVIGQTERFAANAEFRGFYQKIGNMGNKGSPFLP